MVKLMSFLVGRVFKKGFSFTVLLFVQVKDLIA